MAREIRVKIKSIDELSGILSELREKGKIIVQCHGVFDLLHPGHLKHFEAARKKGDILVVTITGDKYVNKGHGRPVFGQDLRAESVAAIESVDYAAVNDSPGAAPAIKKLRPHFYVKGNDYFKKEDDITGKIYEEEAAVESVGGTICFTDEIAFSSTRLINDNLFPKGKNQWKDE